jgi:hypothetical protein
MQLTRYAAVALLAAAAVTAAAGSASAAVPTTAVAQIYSTRTQSAESVTLGGVEHGVRFTVAVDANRGMVVVRTDVGRFTVSGATVALADSHGATVTTLPTAVTVADRTLRMRARVDPAGHTLRLRAIDAAPGPTPAESLGALAGAFLGWPIGAMIGFAIGFLFFVVGSIPGALIGAVIGIVAGGVAGYNWGAAYRP